jgi:TonB-dependent SusC/RagA subfamily outer membrane receptor
LIIAVLAFTILEEDYWLNYITEHFNTYVEKIPQQKVYLQLDRDEYLIGSTLWYKAYVLNSAEQQADTSSRNLYVEMISPDDKVFMQQVLKLKNGLANGDFPMHDTLATGTYLIRAYTHNMKNYGKEFLFSKKIRIINPQKLFYSKEMHKEAKKISRTSENIDLQFFPEGGALISGIKSKLAFKAINTSGLGISVEGKIFTKKGKPVSSFKSSHLGMGFIDFTPEPNMDYYALIEKPIGVKTKFSITKTLDVGYTLNINHEKEKYFNILIKTNKKFANDKTAKTVYLFAQSGGKIYYKSRLQFNKAEIEIQIPKIGFPSGIVHFTVFDGHGKPQCERLAFVNKHDFPNIQIEKKKTHYKTREKVKFTIKVKDKSGEPQRANLSVSVRNKLRIIDTPVENTNIISSLLLEADIKGYIESPSYYFNNTPKAEKDLDLLLLTQAWRKFSWEDILQDSIPDAEFGVEKDLQISGRMTKYLFDISAKHATVELTLLNKFNDVYRVVCDKKGRFSFNGLDYNDTLDILLEFRSCVNRKNIMAVLDEDRDIGVFSRPFGGFYLDSLLIKHKTEYIAMAKEEEDPNKPEDFKIYRNADQIIKFNDTQYAAYSSVMDVLKGRVPGLSVGPNSAMIRGVKSITQSNDPLYLIDGVITSFDAVQSLNVNDVDRVEILKGPSAAIFGSRGGNGVIAVYTKKGFYFKRGEFRFKMLGYHTPKVFYSPKYTVDNINTDKADHRSTVYWKANIKTDKEGKAFVEFYQSDIADEFEIIIEGLSEKGIPCSFSDSYKVEKR